MQNALPAWQVRRLINAMPLQRARGVTPGEDRLTAILFDADHLRAEIARLEGLSRDLRIGLIRPDADPASLRRVLHPGLFGLDYLLNRVDRRILLWTDGLTRPQLMAMTMTLHRAGCHHYTISRFDGPKPKPDFFDENEDQLVRIVNMATDDASRQCVAAKIKAIVTGEPGYHYFSRFSQYWHPIVRAKPGDVVCDAGLGTSAAGTRAFAGAVGGTGYVYGFEPVPGLQAQLRSELDGLANVELVGAGLWSGAAKVDFNEDGNASSFRDAGRQDRSATVTCDLISIDDFFADGRRPPSLIKMDIEGAEQQALLGARETIARHAPDLQICLYHSLSDLLTIPQAVMEMNGAYRFYFGHHSPFFAEFVLYATRRYA